MSAVVPSRVNADIQSLYQACPVGASFLWGNAVGAGVVTLITPGSNVNGAIIRTMFCGAATGVHIAIFAANSAPPAYTDTTRRAIFKGYTASSGGINSWPLQCPLYLPPGVGLYAIASAAGMDIGVSYDLL